MAQIHKGQLSMKRIGVDKTNSRIVVITAAAAFLVVFFLVASMSLFSQLTYQNHVIAAKKQAARQLKSNVTASKLLVTSFGTFSSGASNFIGGNANGNGPQDGANAKLTLDALPSKYDFPALAASLEKLAADQKVEIDSITGTDDEVAQTTPVSTTGAVEIPFQMKVTGDYPAIQRVVTAMEHSIRPIQVKTLRLAGDQKALSMTITAKTFYQPEKNLNILTKVVK